MRRLPSLSPSSFVPSISLALLVLIFFRQAAFTNLIFPRGDTFFYFYPYWEYRAQSLLAGRLPLWNPYIFMGVPFLANSQAGVFYPLNLPLIFFPAPLAVKITIIIHLIIAAWGTYLLARTISNLQHLPAAFAATLFALGGYLTAQVEHVNQLQGLAWMPFALWATSNIFNSKLQTSNFKSPLSIVHSSLFHCSLLSLFIALQLTAGHTQTTFITLVACAIIAIYYHFTLHPFGSRITHHGILEFGFLGFGIFLAFGLSAIQLLPTLELSRLSLRGGGLPLNEAISFSLNPLLIGRALLPGYSRMIFSEFVGYIGVIPLTLAIIGVTAIRRDKLIMLAAIIAFVGLFFAFGGYNPIYLLLARFVPGFNLFRVPARWLVLWAMGASLLAGFGLQSLIVNLQSFKKILLCASAPLLLIVITFLSATITPSGETGPIGLPQLIDVALWLISLTIVTLTLTHDASRITHHTLRYSLFAITLVELLLASQSLPLNHLTTSDAYSSIRPAMTQLLATTNDSTPPGRFLSLSSLEFDPGDMAELKSAWDSQLPASEVYDAIVATKYKEMLSPNLPMIWGIASVDGYDGGILPLRSYAEFAKNFGATGATTDGRLRQMLKAVPPNEMLSLTNTQWIITDKLKDAWIDDVFYDLQFSETITPDKPLTLNRLPRFSADALGLVLAEGKNEGEVSVTLSDGKIVTQKISGSGSARIRWDAASAIQTIIIHSPSSFTLRGATLIDEKAKAFQSLTLGSYRLVHTGDTKIYQNMNVLPRAFILPENPKSQLPNPNETLQTVGKTIITNYEAERIVIKTESDRGGYLILTDTFYPGWVAIVDSQTIEITPAFGLFRSIELPSGSHTVEFRFEPVSLKAGAMISVVSLMVLVVLMISSRFTPHDTHLPSDPQK
jgi:hypothetical protein